MPSAFTITISPGSTSRRNSAPITLNAQDSEAKTMALPLTRPMHSGRTPCGSRTTITSFSVRMVSE